MQFRKLALAAAILTVSTMATVGCGSDTPPPSPDTLSAKAALGALEGASCTIELVLKDGSLANSDLPASITDAEGGTAFNDGQPISFQGPFLVRCEGGTYFDEATKASLPFTGNAISAMVGERPGLSPPTVAVTTATDMAAAALLPVPIDPVLISAAHTEVARALGFPNLNLQTPPETVNADKPSISGTDDGALYAVLLAGLAQFASHLGITPDELGMYLAADVANGLPLGSSVVDGDGAAVNVVGFLDDLDAAVQAVLADAAMVAADVAPALTACVTAQQAAAQSVERGLINLEMPETIPVLPAACEPVFSSPTLPATGGTGGTGGSGGSGGGIP